MFFRIFLRLFNHRNCIDHCGIKAIMKFPIPRKQMKMFPSKFKNIFLSLNIHVIIIVLVSNAWTFLIPCNKALSKYSWNGCKKCRKETLAQMLCYFTIICFIVYCMHGMKLAGNIFSSCMETSLVFATIFSGLGKRETMN